MIHTGLADRDDFVLQPGRNESVQRHILTGLAGPRRNRPQRFGELRKALPRIRAFAGEKCVEPGKDPHRLIQPSVRAGGIKPGAEHPFGLRIAPQKRARPCDQRILMRAGRLWQ